MMMMINLFQDALDEATDPWGVKAERVEMCVDFTNNCNLIIKIIILVNTSIMIIIVAVIIIFDVIRKDVRLPVQLQRAMAAEAEAAREARAKVIIIIIMIVIIIIIMIMLAAAEDNRDDYFDLGV